MVPCHLSCIRPCCFLHRSRPDFTAATIFWALPVCSCLCDSRLLRQLAHALLLPPIRPTWAALPPTMVVRALPHWGRAHAWREVSDAGRERGGGERGRGR